MGGLFGGSGPVTSVANKVKSDEQVASDNAAVAEATSRTDTNAPVYAAGDLRMTTQQINQTRTNQDTLNSKKTNTGANILSGGVAPASTGTKTLLGS